MATAAAGKPFDRDLFCKLVRLMDSANEFERNRATGQAVQMCAARSLRFCDMVAESFGPSGKRLGEVEAALKEAERCGDELACELRRKDDALETLRRVVAVLVGGAILAGWYYRFVLREWNQPEQSYGVVLALVPFVFLVCRWAVIKFKRRNRWVTWRNNDVFRAVARVWNRFLKRFFIEVNV